LWNLFDSFTEPFNYAEQTNAYTNYNENEAEQKHNKMTAISELQL